MIEKEFFSYICSKRFCSFSIVFVIETLKNWYLLIDQFFDKSIQDLMINGFHLNKNQRFS